MKVFEKDPADILDYGWNFTDWLGEDTIQTYNFTIPTGLVEVTNTENNGVVTLWISGGVAKASYIVSCLITTVGQRTKKLSAIFNVVSK